MNCAVCGCKLAQRYAFRHCMPCWQALPFERKKSLYTKADARAENVRLSELRGLLR